MDAELTLPEGWGFKRGYALPDAYRGMILRGAKVFTATGEGGTIIIQTFEQPLFTIRFKVIEFFKSATIQFRHNKASLVSFLALKNNIRYRIKGLGALKLESGQFSLLRCSELSFAATYEKDKVYHSFEVNWSNEILREHVPYFKILEPILQPDQIQKSFFVGKAMYTADHTLLDLANEILKSPYDAALTGISFQHKSREYLFLIMVAIGKVPATGLRLTAEEWAKIDAIAERLRIRPDKKFPIAALAAEAQMNTTKLKEGFKEKYECGMFEYQMAWRMKEAMRLLKETNMNIKEIKDQIGYKSLSSFITKFREYHGYPPGKVVRKHF